MLVTESDHLLWLTSLYVIETLTSQAQAGLRMMPRHRRSPNQFHVALGILEAVNTHSQEWPSNAGRSQQCCAWNRPLLTGPHSTGLSRSRTPGKSYTPAGVIMGTSMSSVALALCLVLHGWRQQPSGQKLCRVYKPLGLTVSSHGKDQGIFMTEILPEV